MSRVIWTTGPGGVRRMRRLPDLPTYAPSPELIAEVTAYLERLDRASRDQAPTRDLALTDADASITGWRDRADAALHYRFPAKEAA